MDLYMYNATRIWYIDFICNKTTKSIWLGNKKNISIYQYSVWAKTILTFLTTLIFKSIYYA